MARSEIQAREMGALTEFAAALWGSPCLLQGEAIPGVSKAGFRLNPARLSGDVSFVSDEESVAGLSTRYCALESLPDCFRCLPA
jgi:hypothetical protein